MGLSCVVPLDVPIKYIPYCMHASDVYLIPIMSQIRPCIITMLYSLDNLKVVTHAVSEKQKAFTPLHVSMEDLNTMHAEY